MEKTRTWKLRGNQSMTRRQEARCVIMVVTMVGLTLGPVPVHYKSQGPYCGQYSHRRQGSGLLQALPE